MRLTFVEEITKLISDNKDIYLISGDLGFSLFESVMERFPKNFINAGVAEQNMLGVATGLAMSGKIVFVYSISNFPVLRCLEQLRNDVCYHNANVKVVSVGCGYSYGLQGYTHFGIEDISIVRALPNIRIFSPADAFETKLCMDEIMQSKGPCYLRLGNTIEKALHEQYVSFEKFSGMIPVHITNSKKTILSVGVITSYVFDKIKKIGLDCNLWSVPIVKPLDKTALSEIAKTSEKIFTIEEHQLQGGFGSSMCEALLDLKNNRMIDNLPEIHRIGIDHLEMSDIGNQHYLREKIDFSALFSENFSQRVLT